MTSEQMLSTSRNLFNDFEKLYHNRIDVLEVDIYTFENLYTVRGSFKVPDKYKVEMRNPMGRLKRDFKQRGLELLIADYGSEISRFAVDTYGFEVEQGLEAIGDDIEAKVGEYITKIQIFLEDGVPKVKYKFFENYNNALKEKIRNTIEDILASYESASADEIDFDDYNNILEMIENGEKD